MKLLLCMMAMLIGLRLSAERPAEEAFSIAYNNYMPAMMWEALQHLKDSPDYERSFEKYAQMFSAEDYLDSFFDESPFSVFGPDFLFQAALYNACATRDFSLAERLLLLYGRHPQATQQMKLKFERDVTLAKKEFPELIFSWCFPIMENRKRDAF